MILNCLFPVFALILLGFLMRRLKLIGDRFIQTSDRLVYFVFFPALLFLKVGGSRATANIDWVLYAATLSAMVLVFLVSIASSKMLALSPKEAGAFSQSCYRANTYIGMAVVIAALGDSGAAPFGVFLGMVIPVVNVLAVSTLVIYAGPPTGMQERVLPVVRSLIGNPLILACAAGFIYSAAANGFTPFVESTLQLTAAASLPLALISIGGALKPGRLNVRLSIPLTAALIKVAVFPLVGYVMFRLFGVHGLSFKMGMIFFALSVAPSAYVLASQLGSDVKLASEAIVASTILSFFSLSIVLVLFVQ